MSAPRQLYASYSDANSDVVLASFRSKQEDLENEMQLKFNVYSTVSAQYRGGEGTRAGTHSGFHLAQRRSGSHQRRASRNVCSSSLAMTLLAAFVITLYSVRDYLLKD